MMFGRRRRDEERALARAALRQAPGSEEPQLSRLVASVPELLAEARRRGLPGRTGLDSALAVPLRRALPMLAAATAAILVLVSAAVIGDRGETGPGGTSVDALLLTGGESGGSGDDLLAAIVSVEQGHD
jgi:hypothetical protein